MNKSILQIIPQAEQYLNRRWSLHIKPPFKLLMVAHGVAICDMTGGWSQFSSFPVLGHILQSDGGSRACREAAVKGAWRAYWANIGAAKYSKLSVALRLETIYLTLRVWASFKDSVEKSSI